MKNHSSIHIDQHKTKLSQVGFSAESGDTTSVLIKQRRYGKTSSTRVCWCDLPSDWLRQRPPEVFFTDADRELSLSTLAGVAVGTVGSATLSLMANHYHLLIETPKANLSIGMRQLKGIYTQTFNRRHNRVGHLFHGRFKAILVERESHLLELCRYIVLNPLRVNISVRSQPGSGAVTGQPLGWLRCRSF
jgi:hypothetical protein